MYMSSSKLFVTVCNDIGLFLIVLHLGADREDLEDAEEEEALKIQQRLAEEIDEDQFELFQVL